MNHRTLLLVLAAVVGTTLVSFIKTGCQCQNGQDAILFCSQLQPGIYSSMNGIEESEVQWTRNGNRRFFFAATITSRSLFACSVTVWVITLSGDTVTRGAEIDREHIHFTCISHNIISTVCVFCGILVTVMSEEDLTCIHLASWHRLNFLRVLWHFGHWGLGDC